MSKDLNYSCPTLFYILFQVVLAVAFCIPLILVLAWSTRIGLALGLCELSKPAKEGKP